MAAITLKPLFLGLLFVAITRGWSQELPAVSEPAESSAVWLKRVQQLPFPAQVAALREKVQADARRTFRNDASQMPGCLTGVSAASREALEAARRSAPDTVVQDNRVLCILNGRPLTGREAATILTALPVRTIRELHFLAGASASAWYGTRAAGGVVQVKAVKQRRLLPR